MLTPRKPGFSSPLPELVMDTVLLNVLPPCHWSVELPVLVRTTASLKVENLMDSVAAVAVRLQERVGP